MEEKGYFRVNPWFFAALFSHIVLFILAGQFTLWYFGNTWPSWLAAAVLVTAGQVWHIIVVVALLKMDRYYYNTSMHHYWDILVK